MKKIFCISMQRTGTTSVGKFFAEFGFKCCGWRDNKKNSWGKLAFDQDYEKIFESDDFINGEVFEDAPWGNGHFYKYLFYRFPEAQFILFTRNADKWFNSMMNHSDGKTLGNTFRHCCLYNRESEYYKQMGLKHHYDVNDKDNLLEINENHRQHYIDIYNNRNRQALDFFNAKDPLAKRFIHLDLEDKNKWVSLGNYFGIRVPEDYEIHANKSKN